MKMPAVPASFAETLISRGFIRLVSRILAEFHAQGVNPVQFEAGSV
jgi:hypothetical protein